MAPRTFKVEHPIGEGQPRPAFWRTVAAYAGLGLSAAATLLASPIAIGLMLTAVGFGLAAIGVYVLAGLGWALLIASMPFLLLGILLLKGAARVG